MNNKTTLYERQKQYLELLILAKETDSNITIGADLTAAAFGLSLDEFNRRHNAGEYTLICERATQAKNAPKRFFILNVDEQVNRRPKRLNVA
ncbi:MAG: hypothetical protein AAF512_01390 [Pseudomonadota bacterium]